MEQNSTVLALECWMHGLQTKRSFAKLRIRPNRNSVDISWIQITNNFKSWGGIIDRTVVDPNSVTLQSNKDQHRKLAGLTGMTCNHKGSGDRLEEQQKHGGDQQATGERRSQDLSDWSRTQTNFRTVAGLSGRKGHLSRIKTSKPLATTVWGWRNTVIG